MRDERSTDPLSIYNSRDERDPTTPQITALVTEFSAACDTHPAEQGYSLTILMHPLQLSPPDEGERET